MSSIIILKTVYILFGSILAFHPVHVSVTNIEINTARQEMNYSVRIFADDFAYALEHHYEMDISFSDGISGAEQEIVIKYINDMFVMSVDDSLCTPECKKIETIDNSLWIHFKVMLAETEISSLKVTNKLLLDFFPDQTNLTIFTINGKQMGYTFDYINREANISVNETEIDVK